MTDTTLSNMTASGALTGPELFYSVVAGADRKVTATQIQTFTQQVLPWTIVAKSADESRNTTTTYADDATLKFAVLAGTNYRFRITIFYTTSATADIKWQLTGPASPTAVHYGAVSLTDGDTFTSHGRTAFSNSISETSTTAISGSVVISGMLQNGINAGTITLQWAQNTSDPGNTTVQGGSFIEYATV